MRKHLARIFFIIAAFSIFFAVSVNAEEVESEYTKGITILDEIPSSITYGDTAPVPKIKINGVTFEPGSYTLWYTFDAPDKSAIGYPDYMTPLKSGTCYVGINLAGNTDLCIYLAQLNGESTFAAPAIYRIASFEVNKADMSKCTADPIADVVYDPDDTPLKGISPSVNLYFKGRQLTWQDFDKEYKNNKQAGTATVICTPKDYKPFKGQKTLTFKILPFQLDSQSSISEIADQTYTGNAITPSSFTVYPRKWSTSSDNYTVTYSNNVNVGTATVTVKGKNSLSGSISTTFQITPENISKTTVTISDQVYSGAALKPTPVLTFNGKTLTAGKDYKITGYSDNVNAKTYAYAKISIEGLGNFAGSSVTRSFKILPADISKATFTYTPVVYNRSSYKWEGFTVKYKSVTLKEGTDYTVSRLSADGLTVQWKVTGKGNFQGETTVTQTLLPLDLNDFVAEAYISGSYTYTGSSIKPASVSFRTSEGNNPRLESNVDYKLSYGTNINAGQGTVTVAGIGKYTGTLTVNFTINQASICNADIADIGEQAYTGLPIKPEISATFKGKTLVKDKDYTLSYTNNTSAGTATVRIDGKGNFYSYDTKKFKIVEHHDVSVADISDIVCDYGKRPTPVPEVIIDGKKGVKGTDFTISWDFGSEPACKAYVYIRVTKETITKPFALKYDIASVTVSDISDVIATGSAMEPEITIIAGTTVLTEGKHYTLSYSDNISEGTGIVTITGINNFTGSREVSFTILAPTSTPTEQPTETPTATPTEVPEETATPVPTEGPSDNPGLTATPVPTGPDATVTATPVPSTTAEPAVSATPSPAETTQAPSSTDTDPAGTGSDSATPGPAVSAAPVPTDSNTAVIKGNTYKITGKKTAALLKAAKKAKLTVPATVKIRGKKYKVTAILNKAAINNKKLKKIVIGKNVRKIGKKSFAGCRKVKTVQFKTKKISSVGKNAFKGINSKAKFIFKGNAAKIKKHIRKSGYKKI